MKYNKGVALKVCMMLCAIMALTACSVNKNQNEGEIQILFPCIWVGEDSKAEVFSQIVDDFNEQNKGLYHIVIENQTDYDAYQDMIRTQISTGNAPDIFTVKTKADVEYYSKSGKVQNLTDYVDSISERFMSGTLNDARNDSDCYAIPYEMAYIPIMYNQCEFDKYGLDIPDSFEELWDVCDKFKENGVAPICQMTGGGNAWTSMLWYTYALASVGGEDVYTKDYNSDAYIKAADILKKAFEYTTTDAVGADASVVNGHFFKGDSVIYANGTWILGRINSDEVTYEHLYDNLTFGTGLASENANGNGFISYGQAYIMVGKQSDERKLKGIEEFITFITDETRIAELTNSSGALFAINVDATKIHNEKTVQILELAQKADFIIPSFEAQAKTSVANAFPSLLEELILDEISSEEFANKLYEIN